ncbi:MAG: hypothetical protein ABJF04_02400 [Reichenbachiella sp.]|uniref:hypothetical protein n=2 Tax=Reichenbachiella sp. TaxID=2184521 RepID=UPI0032658835
MTRILLLLVFLTSLSPLSVAQEVTEEDPFSDYSYLWESTKKDKKKKKKNMEVKQPLPLTDSLAEQPAPLPSDSIQLEEPTVVVDSIENSVDNLAATEAQILQDSLKQAQREAKRAEREEKGKDDKPREDFRAGLPPLNTASAINGGFTYTVIDGNAYAGLVLAPEIKIGKVGVGIDVPILYGLDDKSFRTEMFEDGVGALRLIRYIRYGQQKVDPVYVKVGTLSGTMLGYGGLINNYSNSTSYEKRKIGLHYDFNVKGLVGIEGIYSDFDPSSFNLFAIRPYVRPLSWSFVPIVKTLEIGTTILSDKDQTSLLSSSESTSTYAFTKQGISAFGIDAGLTLLQVPFIQIDLFANYSKLNVISDTLTSTISTLQTAGLIETPTADFKKGSGISAGLNFRFHFIADLLSTDIRIERLSYSDYYLPQFFDTSYEINKDGKILSLASAEKTQGIYGSLTGHVLKKLSLGGSLMIPDNISEATPALVTLHADVDRLFDKYSVHANYFKGGLSDLGDAFSLDERSLLKVRFIYHMNKFLMTGVDYFYTFTPTENGYETTKYVSPFIGLSIQF